MCGGDETGCTCQVVSFDMSERHRCPLGIGLCDMACGSVDFVAFV